jgi:ribonuclease HI
MKYLIHTDGGSRGNPGPAASAFVATDEAGDLIYQEGFYIGDTTNNQAEYRAVLFALNWFLKQQLPNPQVNFFLDSLLVVNQLRGLYKIKNPDLLPIYQDIRDLIDAGNIKIAFTHIPREKNSLADALVNKVLDSQLQK